MRKQLHPGSALLLAIMVISVLTTTTLGAIAIRFDQLIATDRITSASKAKLAADSGLIKLREKLSAAQTTFSPEAYDITSEESVTIPDQGRFRPNPRHSVYSLESQVINLPRCLAVAVLSPWVNTGTYLLDNDDSSSNPSLLFYYANIINDTQIGTIDLITGGDSDEEKDKSISELTKLGQFYNPYAPSGYSESNRNYWTIKLGGPQDEFLYKKDPSGLNSFYKNLDFVYVPYLPRFTDSGVLKTANQPDSGLVRKDAATIRNDFENVIKNNNLKVWLDASVTNDLLYQYGLADLFTDTGEEDSRVTWLQPSLWNDLPESDTELGYASGLSGPHVLDNINTVTTGMQWQRQNTPVKGLGGDDAGWAVEIARGSKSLSFVYPSGDLNRPITPNSVISFNFFGSLEGLRLNQPITVTAIQKGTSKPVSLMSRDSTSQGRYYNVRVTEITKLGNGEVSIELTFYNGTYQTPKKSNDEPAKLSDISVMSLQAGPQHATKRSVSNVTLKADGKRVTMAASSCEYSEVNFVVCPAVGDIVNFSKPNNEPAWGRVTDVTFSGSSMTGFELDKFREMPLPTRDLASTVVTEGVEKIAYYGGAVTATEFDGGVNGISDGFWLYNPAEPNQNAAWVYLPNNGVEVPGPRTGASIAAVGSSIYLFGGYRYEGIGELGVGKPCADNYQLITCLGLNRPGARVAKVFPNTMFRYDLGTRQWSKITYHSDNTNQLSLTDNPWLELKTVSRFGERSGKDGWQTRVTVDASTTRPATLSITPDVSTTLTLTTSNAGVAVGDEMYVSGTNSVDSSSFLTWGRIVGMPTPNSVQVKVYGIKDAAGTVSLKSASITVLNRTKGSARCNWQDTTKSCQINERIDGIGLGDAVVLEHYDNYDPNPTRLLATYSGYVSSISGNIVTFNSFDTASGFNDYQSGTPIGGESVRLMPIGRAGGKLAVNGNNLYYWQGDQSQNSSNARTVDIWDFDTVTSRWSPVQLAMGTLPAGLDLNLQSIKMPGQATVFTSTSVPNNQELKKDKEIAWENNGVRQIEIVWDDAKEWQLEISDESGNSHWNQQRVTEGATLTIERQNGNSRERFTGIVVGINTATPSRVTVKHHPSFSGDGGILLNSANAKVTISYPNYNNSSSVSVLNSVRQSGVDGIQVAAENPAKELRKIPLGAVLMAYSGSLSGTNTSIVTATVDSRSIIGPNVVRFNAAGPAFMTTPLQQSQSTNAFVGGGADKLALSYQSYRPKHTEGAMEWVSNLTGSTNAKKWVGRFPLAYGYNGPNRPAPRQNGILSVSPDKSTAYIAGGTYGPYTNVWRLQNAHSFIGSSWTLGKSNVSVTGDIPNLYGSTAEIMSSGRMVVFGGQRRFTNATLGPKVFGRSNGNTNNDGTFSIVDLGADKEPKAAQFTNQLQSQYDGVAKDSLKFTSAPTSGVFTDVCQYIAQVNCDYQLMRHLGTLGRFGSSWGNSLAVLDPGTGFKSDSGKRSLILSGPTQSIERTNARWDQEGYTPYKCDTIDDGCSNFPFGSLKPSQEADNSNSKTLMFAGFSRITGGGSILVTPAGVGRAITTGPAGNSYCGRDSINKNDNPGLDYYSCKSSSLQARYMKWIPDSEDILFMFNAAKALSSTDAYRVVGYYGGVVRGYLAVSVGSELNVQEIAP